MAERVASRIQAGNGFGVARFVARVVEIGTITGTETYTNDNGETISGAIGQVESFRVEAQRGVVGLITVKGTAWNGATLTRRFLAGMGETLSETVVLPQPMPMRESLNRILRWEMSWIAPQRVIADLIEMDDPPIAPREAIRRLVGSRDNFDKLLAQYNVESQRALRDRYRAHRDRVRSEEPIVVASGPARILISSGSMDQS